MNTLHKEVLDVFRKPADITIVRANRLGRVLGKDRVIAEYRVKGHGNRLHMSMFVRGADKRLYLQPGTIKCGGRR